MTDISKIENAIYETDDFITMLDALKIYPKISKWTMIRWCRVYKIGIKVGGRWMVDPDKLALLISGKLHYPATIKPDDKRRKENKRY